ncbi:MAG: ECF transporter S component [Lachnospiraceae bacterium]|nr:ECF transporter S component [Lachnospiraceae bacterium]
MKPNKVLNVKNVVLIGMFGALAAVLETFQISVPFAPPFYKLDFAETPIMVGAFALGPIPAVLMELVKNILKLLIKGTTTMYVGDLGNFIGGSLFVLPASILYQRKRTRKTAMYGLGLSIVIGVLTALIINCFMTIPLYAKLMFNGIENIIAMGTAVNPAITNLYTFAIFAILPFNLLKLGMNAAVTALVYKRVSVILRAGAPERAARTSPEKG